jgi:hypothetical protein
MSKKEGPGHHLGRATGAERVVSSVLFGDVWMNFTSRTVSSTESSDMPSTCPPVPTPNRAEAFLMCGSRLVQESLLTSPNG